MSLPILEPSGPAASPVPPDETPERLSFLLDEARRLSEVNPSLALDLAGEAGSLAGRLGDTGALARSFRLAAWARNLLGDYAAALRDDQSALELYRAGGDTAGEAAILQSIGSIQFRQGHYPAALDNYQQAIELFRAIGSRQGEASVFSCTGIVHRHLTDYPLALDYYRQARQIYRELGDRAGEAGVLDNLSILYSEMEDYESALEFARESLFRREETGDRRGQANLLVTLAGISTRQGETEQAAEFLRRGMNLLREMPDPLVEAHMHLGFGQVYRLSGDASSALAALAHALALFRNLGDRRGQAETLLELGETPAPARPQETLAAIREALELAHALGARDIQLRAHLILARLEKSAGHLAEAIEHHEAHHQLLREIFHEKSDRRIRFLQITHQVEYSLQEAELHRLRSVELAEALAEAERQRSAAQEASRQKSEILRVAAHDLRNAIGNLSSLCNLTASTLREEGFTSSPALEFADLAEQLADNLLDTLNRLLDSEAIENGKISLSREIVNLGQIAAAVHSLSRPHATAKRQSLHFRAHPGCRVHADPVRIRQVIDNLVGNAIKYSPPGLGIHLTIESLNGNAICTVQDEGPGITEEDMKRIFRPFQRLSARPTAGENSVGLGLSIVRQIVDLHGGVIRVESTGDGHGAAFIVELPLA